MSQFKKGDKIYLFGVWSHDGTWYFERFTVSSWGKKQATLVRDDGSNFKRQVYVNAVNNSVYAWHLYLVDELDNPRAKALELSQAYVAWERARKERCIAENADSPLYVRSMIKSLEALAPGVRD